MCAYLFRRILWNFYITVTTVPLTQAIFSEPSNCGKAFLVQTVG